MLMDECLMYLPDVNALWQFTADELCRIADAGRRRLREMHERRVRENELLAFNIGALVLTAFNAPQRFPQDPDRAFGHKTRSMHNDGGKSAFMAVADRINDSIGTDNKGIFR